MDIVVVIFFVMIIVIGFIAAVSPDKETPPQIDYTEQNQAYVVGWEFADSDDLRDLPPQELQDRLDASNPLSVELSKVKGALELLGPSPRG